MLEMEKQKLVKSYELNELRDIEINDTEQMGNMYASAMLRQEERINTLRESKFVALGISHKDGPEMQRVKECQRLIGLAMKDSMLREEVMFRSGLNRLMELYYNMVEACNAYIQVHPSPKTSSGKERLRLVTAALQMAQQEKEQLQEKAEKLYNAAVKWDTSKLVWGNVLGMIRGMDFDLNQVEGTRTLGGGTSDLKVINAHGKEYFFKEAEKLTTPMGGFKEYCQNSSKDKKEERIYQKLYQLMKDNTMRNQILLEMVEMFRKADTEEKMQVAYEFLRDEIKSAGIVTDLDLFDQHTLEILKDGFMKYDKLATRYDTARMAGISAGEDLSKRNVLTSRMAAIMKMPQLVVLSNQAMLHRGEQKEQTGIVMAKATGREAAALSIEAIKERQMPMVYTPEMIRQIANLQLFDMICGQVDRNFGNRFYTYEERNGKYIVTGVQGIDNDMSFGSLRYEDIKNGSQELKRFEKEGVCTLPGLDKAMVETLSALRKETLTYCFSDLLEEAQIDALWDRIEGIKNIIAVTLQKNPDFLIEQWNRQTVERFSGKGAEYFYLSDLKKEEIA